jgi:hypothetical protein
VRVTANTDSELRILEVGRIPLFKYVYPELTTWIRTGSSLVFGDEDCVAFKPNLSAFVDLVRDLSQGRFALLVLPAVHLDYQYDVNISKKLLRRAIGAVASFPLVGWVARKLLRPSRTAIAFLDVYDSPQVSSVNYSLVSDALCYFKRELYPSVSFGGVPNPEWWCQHAEPISLPAPAEFEALARPKTIDVFFSGNIYTDVRRNGLRELECLASEGLNIDIVLERLPYREYMRRMAASWLVWSPSGHGWDCYRHYEACVAGCVPVIDLPLAERILWLRDREHCFYYSSRCGELSSVLRAALADKRRLREMANSAKTYVATNHSRPALVRYMLEKINKHLAAARHPEIVTPDNAAMPRQRDC